MWTQQPATEIATRGARAVNSRSNDVHMTTGLGTQIRVPSLD